MSLFIDTNTIRAVLLGDQWHDVKGGTFDVDSYEFQQDETLVHGGGRSDVCATGFTFLTDSGARMWGPLTAIQAVSDKPQAKNKPKAREE